MDNLRDFWPKTGTGGAGTGDPDRIGPYCIEQELGRGFSSVVYQAQDERRGRRVALKVLTFLQSLSEDRRADLSRRFAREARAISALSHPNIVAIFDIGEASDGRQFIAMERLRGETLRSRLQRGKPLPVPQAVSVAVRVADALHYAHGRGIVHRDVKPDNLFLTDGEGDEPILPKLMDFGIAHVLSDQALTQDGTIVGSPAYMSPEQINGGVVDARTDVFSLAVTLTEMVTGTKPFEGDTVPAVMQQILRHAPDLKRVPDPALRRVLARALSKNPQARPDAEMFALALRQAVPLAGLSPTVATQIFQDAPGERKFLGLARRPSLAALGLGGLALTILALLPLLAPRPTHTLAQSPPRLAVGPTAQRCRIAAFWHPADAPPAHIAWTKIARTATPSPMPRPAVAIFPTPTLRTARTAAPPAAPAAPQAPAAPLPPAAPRPPLPLRPVLAAPLTAAARPSAFSAAPPIVRVESSRQELTLPPKPFSVPPTVQVPADTPMGSDPLPPAPREPGLADSGPRPLHRTLPGLPADAPAGLAGASVRLRVWVDEDGAVTDAAILQSSGSPVLDQAALACVRQWEYDPAIQNGQSAPSETTEQVKFNSR